jgi:dolichol kinase
MGYMEEKINNEIIRQIIHIYSGLVILALSLILGLKLTAYIIFIFLFIFLLYINLTGSNKENGFMRLTREEENKIFPAKGAICYFSSLLFLASYEKIPFYAFLSALLALSLGDGFATLGGKAFKSKGKSLIGTFLGFIPLFLSYIIIGFSPYFSLIVSVFAMLIERVSVIDDNIFLPFSVASFSVIVSYYGISP